MQYNTALGFLFFGLGLICINLEKLILGSFFGAITLLIGMITLAEYLWGLNTGLDELFMEGYVTVMTSHPGRMAPNTALCFLLSGLALVLVNPIHRKTKLIGLFQPLETFGAVITGLALVALVGYLFDIEYASGWGSQVRMAIHTSIGFCVVGFGLIIYKFPNLEEGGVPGLPVFSQEMLNGTLWFVLKTVGVIFFILLPRGVFPRIRIDMLLHIGWYKLIGLSFVNIFIALGLVYAGVIGPGGIL